MGERANCPLRWPATAGAWTSSSQIEAFQFDFLAFGQMSMELRASPPKSGACLPHLPSGAQVDEGCYEAMSPEYLAKLLTPFPLSTKDGSMPRSIGDTGAYCFTSEEAQGLAHWEGAQATVGEARGHQ